MRVPRIAEGPESLSLADIARHFDLPESTARYYCKRFSMFIPSVGEGRRRRYKHQTLNVIAAVLEHMRTSRTAAQVEEALRHEFPCTMDALVPMHKASALRSKAASLPMQASAQQLASGQQLAQDSFSHVALELLEKQTRAMADIATSLQILATRQGELERLASLAETTANDNARLRTEVSNLRVLLDTNEKLQQGDLDQIRTWVGKILRNRPQTVSG